MSQNMNSSDRELHSSDEEYLDIEVVRANMTSILNMVLDIGSIVALAISLIEIYQQYDLKLLLAVEGFFLLIILLIGLTFQCRFEDRHRKNELGFFEIKLDSFLEKEGVTCFFEKYSGNMAYLYYFLIPAGFILPIFDFVPSLIVTGVAVFLYIVSVIYSRKNSKKAFDTMGREKGDVTETESKIQPEVRSNQCSVAGTAFCDDIDSSFNSDSADSMDTAVAAHSPNSGGDGEHGDLNGPDVSSMVEKDEDIDNSEKETGDEK